MNQFKIWRLHRVFFRESYLRWLFLAVLVLTILILRTHRIGRSPAG
jgi:hypothetical protein